MESGRLDLAALYVVSSILGGLAAGALGFYIGGKRVKGC